MGFTSPLSTNDAPLIAPEREALEKWLDFHRAELLNKLEGLEPEQTRRSLVGSLTTLHGLVRHMAWVEHHWFVTRLGRSDEPNHYDCTVDPDADWRLSDGADLDADVARFVTACDRSREILSGLSLDDTRPFGKRGDGDVRWVLIHMIEEYARHIGHADILRELTDGATTD